MSTPAAPVITSVQCRIGGSLPSFTLVWTPQQDFTGPFSVVVTNSVGGAITGTTTGANPNGATWTATQTMTATADMYYVQVAVTSNPTIISDKVPLLFAPDTAIKTAFDGVTLSVNWTQPASLTPAGTTQILLLTPAGAQVVVTDNATFGEMAVSANLRNSGGDWSVYLTPQFAVSSGPQSDAAIVYNTVPLINTVVVTGVAGDADNISAINLAVGVSMPGASVPQTAFATVLKANGVTVVSNSLATGTWSGGNCQLDVSLTYPFNLAFDFEIALAQSAVAAGVATGPYSIPVKLVLLPPQQISATVSASGSDRIVDATLVPLAGSWSPNGSRFWINGSVNGQTFGFTKSLTLTAPTIGGAYALFGAQASGNSIGPWSGGFVYPGSGVPGGTGLPLITSIPALSTIAIENGVASLNWTAIPDTGLSGYRVTATVAGAVVASGVFTGTSGNLAVREDGASFAVCGVAGPITGPFATAVAAITAAPSGLSANWSSTGTSCTLAWVAPAGSGAAPNGYTVTVYNGETQVHQTSVSGTSYVVPAGILTQAGGFSFRVTATKSGTPTLTGPSSARAAIAAAAPSSLNVAYDGATLAARWAPVADATGYRAVLLLAGAESGNPWFADQPATSVSLAFDSEKTYSLAVQAMGPGTTGPAATTAVFGAGFYPQFAANTAAALIPASAPAMTPYAIAIGLPQIFTSPPQDALPSTPPFSLASGTDPYSYVLTIAGTTGALPWTFSADAIRADLYTAYSTFLGQLQTAGATALGMQTVQTAIARSMPQTFAETLLYSYGFTGASGWADLKPGMVLRVEYESYQTMAGATPDQAQLNGFITSGVAQYQISRSATNAAGFTTLDAFIGWLVGLGGTAVTAPPVSNRKQAGGGGLIDSGYPLMQQPFLRLVYPPSFPDTNQIGTPYPEFNALLLAAANLSDLEAATTNARSGAAAGNNVGALYFRGRTTMVPQIRIWVNGMEQLVPLGTTIGEILAERAMEPSSVGLPITGLGLRRGIGPALVGSPASYDAGGEIAVRLDWAPAGNAELIALPLLGGDRIEFGGGTA